MLYGTQFQVESPHRGSAAVALFNVGGTLPPPAPPLRLRAVEGSLCAADVEQLTQFAAEEESLAVRAAAAGGSSSGPNDHQLRDFGSPSANNGGSGGATAATRMLRAALDAETRARQADAATCALRTARSCLLRRKALLEATQQTRSAMRSVLDAALLDAVCDTEAAALSASSSAHNPANDLAGGVSGAAAFPAWFHHQQNGASIPGSDTTVASSIISSLRLNAPSRNAGAGGTPRRSGTCPGVPLSPAARSFSDKGASTTTAGRVVAAPAPPTFPALSHSSPRLLRSPPTSSAVMGNAGGPRRRDVDACDGGLVMPLPFFDDALRRGEAALRTTYRQWAGRVPQMDDTVPAAAADPTAPDRIEPAIDAAHTTASPAVVTPAHRATLKEAVGDAACALRACVVRRVLQQVVLANPAAAPVLTAFEDLLPFVFAGDFSLDAPGVARPASHLAQQVQQLLQYPTHRGERQQVLDAAAQSRDDASYMRRAMQHWSLQIWFKQLVGGRRRAALFSRMEADLERRGARATKQRVFAAWRLEAVAARRRVAETAGEQARATRDAAMHRLERLIESRPVVDPAEEKRQRARSEALERRVHQLIVELDAGTNEREAMRQEMAALRAQLARTEALLRQREEELAVATAGRNGDDGANES